MIKILLLSAGTNANYHVAKTLKEKFQGKFCVIGADINEQHLICSCKCIDRFYKVPYSSDSAYYDVIIDICEKEKINYILPSFDKDQKLFYPENNDLLRLGVRSFGVSKKTLGIYDNKVSMNEFLKKNGFKIPKVFDPNEIEDGVQYFVKPVDGVGSQGVRSVYGSDLRQSETSNVIIQEKCSAPEVTLECFFYKRELRTVARERIASKSGVCTKARIFNSFQLHKVAEAFTEKVKIPYYFNLQFMKNSENEYVITDVNLRLAGGMSLSAAAGWDEVSALAKIMLSQSEKEVFATLPEVVRPQYIVRAYTDIVTRIERPVVAFDLDGTLVDSRERHRVVLDDILVKYNLKIDTSDLIEFKRNNKNNVDYLVSKGIEKSIAERIQNSWISNIEDESYLKLDALYEDTIELLEKYKRENDLILITARSREQAARNQIKQLGIADYFKKVCVVSTRKDISKQKSEILRKEGAILMIGDTVSDYNAAGLAEIKFKFRENGFHNEKIIGRN